MKEDKMTRKIKTSVTLDKDLLEWIDKLIKRKRFASRTHAIEYALQRLREEERDETVLRTR